MVFPTLFVIDWHLEETWRVETGLKAKAHLSEDKFIWATGEFFDFSITVKNKAKQETNSDVALSLPAVSGMSLHLQVAIIT